MSSPVCVPGNDSLNMSPVKGLLWVLPTYGRIMSSDSAGMTWGLLTALKVMNPLSMVTWLFRWREGRGVKELMPALAHRTGRVARVLPFRPRSLLLHRRGGTAHHDGSLCPAPNNQAQSCLFQFWNFNPDCILSHNGKKETQFLMPLSTHYALCVWLPGVVTVYWRSVRNTKNWQSYPTISTPHRYGGSTNLPRFLSPYMEGNATTADGTCSEIQDTTSILLPPGPRLDPILVAKKSAAGDAVESIDKSGIWMAKYCIDIF